MSGLYDKYILPRLIDRVCGQRPIGKQREKVVGRARGTVLEIGIAGGLNLGYYNAEDTDRVVGIDPSNALFDTAQQRADERAIPLETIKASAENMPFENTSFDSVVLTFTLCTIPSVESALAEIHRVLKPNGQLLLAEHGLADEENIARWQNRLSPAWSKIAGGCNLNRPIDRLVQSAGFKGQLQQGFIPGWRPGSYHYWGGLTV